MQSSITVSDDATSWWLINASPDLSAQIENFAPLQPLKSTPRNSPIAGVLLTNADIDHAFGILLMRQRESRLPVYASSDTRAKLDWLEELMQRFCGIEWRELPPDVCAIDKQLQLRSIHLPRSVALEIHHQENRVVIAPAVGEITSELYQAMKRAGTIIFDGTFWSDDELRSIRPGAKSAREMGHLPVKESLPLLGETQAARKVYTHINNTNPILRPDSRERQAVESAGIIVGYDGLAF